MALLITAVLCTGMTSAVIIIAAIILVTVMLRSLRNVMGSHSRLVS
jgi:hypothetical protein